MPHNMKTTHQHGGTAAWTPAQAPRTKWHLVRSKPSTKRKIHPRKPQGETTYRALCRELFHSFQPFPGRAEYVPVFQYLRIIGGVWCQTKQPMGRHGHSQLLVNVATGKQGTGTLMFCVGDTANISVSDYIAPYIQQSPFPCGLWLAHHTGKFSNNLPMGMCGHANSMPSVATGTYECILSYAKRARPSTLHSIRISHRTRRKMGLAGISCVNDGTNPQCLDNDYPPLSFEGGDMYPC
jgi:hypothetical protein